MDVTEADRCLECGGTGVCHNHVEPECETCCGQGHCEYCAGSDGFMAMVRRRKAEVEHRARDGLKP